MDIIIVVLLANLEQEFDKPERSISRYGVFALDSEQFLYVTPLLCIVDSEQAIS